MSIIQKIARMFCGHREPPPRWTVDVPSPRDLIDQKNIIYDKPLCQLRIKNLAGPIWLTTVLDTNSMDPVMDANHTLILSMNFEAEDLCVGDVIVYRHEPTGSNIIHRIIAIRKDEYGLIFTMKGDNNAHADNAIVRERDLLWLLLGVIY